MLLTSFLSLGACSQIADTTGEAAPTDVARVDVAASAEPSPADAIAQDGINQDGINQDGITQDRLPDDQLQQLENPPSTLAATATEQDVEWITFELDDFFDETHEVKAAIPAGWVPHEVFEDRWQPVDGSGHGFFTDIGFDQGCDGVCEAKDWEAALNGPNGQLSRTRDEFEVLRDEPIDQGWILITEGFVVSQRVDVFRWNDDADFFFQCRVELDEEDVYLVDEMVEICLLADPLWLD